MPDAFAPRLVVAEAVPVGPSVARLESATALLCVHAVILFAESIQSCPVDTTGPSIPG